MLFVFIFIVLLIVTGLSIFFASNSPSKNKVAVLALAAIPVSVAVACLAILLMFRDPQNDLRLRRFAWDMAGIDHPSESELLASHAIVGKFSGNSNHCDYFAGQLRWAPLSVAEIEDYYASATIPPAQLEGQNFSEGPSHDVAIHVIVVASEGVIDLSAMEAASYGPILPYSFDEPSELAVNLSDYPEGTLYLVSALDYGYPPGRDMRCH